MSDSNRFAIERRLVQEIDASLLKISGESLPCPEDVNDRFLWIHHDAPYALLAHKIAEEPTFIYANQCALNQFKYTEEAFLGMPSKMSATSANREERQAALNQLNTHDIVCNYSGERINKHGETFTIYDGKLWKVSDTTGHVFAIAALFWPSPNGAVEFTERYQQR
ncbi:MEKHLA domain-containing protein [Samsonia erythrinae]|uniref:MEKHLA domain-containing protein n=1 Tax=Samsonia erythrinae TaxID=160434 RepID=A0A4R3VJN9_9GAMM|nr:MEKHLA domain-containing protein [Samsonia erythrinae]TCV04054.1 MEKHLA domain-containing protein [Samsonia erythrinae]